MITGEIKKILTQKDNDWGRYELLNAGKKTLAVGVIPNASIGMLVTLEGGEEVNKYGRQFKISSVINVEADKNAGVVRFLADGYVKYIGLAKARAIANAFGRDALKMFETEEGRIMLSTVKGLGTATIEKALPSFEENKKYMDIVMFLNGTGTKLQVQQIYDKYGDDAVKTLKKNPYVLQTDLDGFGFIKADNLAMGCGIKPDSIYRLQAAVYYVIENAQQAGGHCFQTMEEIREQIVHILCPMPKFPDDTTEKTAENAAKNWAVNREKFIKKYDPCAETLELIDRTVESRTLILDTLADAISQSVENGTLVNDYGRIYTAKMYNVETSCAKMLKDMLSEHSVRFIEKDVIEKSIKNVEARKTKEMEKSSLGTFVVTEEQRKAVYLGLMNRVSIISGGPGRGKTAIAEIIAESFLNAGKRYDKKDIIMLAPTGRAAQRMTESTGYDAMTAHRAIFSMEKTGQAPEGKLILCDESSMVDIFLMHKILKYARDCNIIFIGDVDQIASVGPGKVLKDMIDSEVIPCILLKQGHRNSGTIAHNSELINAGMKIDKYCYDEHFVYIPANSDNIADLIVADYKKKVEQYGITNVMLCAAMRERGCVAVNKLNSLLQDEFTKGKDEAVYSPTLKFRVGDRVMQTKNDYNFEMRRGGEMVQGIFNGEKGTVQKIMPDEENDSYKMIVKFDDGSVGGYTKATALNLTLAYATTLHKCQGSEAVCMMMAYTFGDYILLNRSLFYTGETRAKKEFRFYGEEKFQYGRMLSAFDIAVGKTDDNERNTALSERLREAV
ncbi:MAG: AAA family ATPase [Butyrivibrio sp.]|uniref:ATP-dependent DNA helicase n=1 Tax=Butyrivibrio sp. TaxID=28121 RepID=UPI001B42B9AC|nr:ATP-dependent RecD-like DNA helicase [Butyrivibrio sp.]MBP3280720.1 AAA family ATPase [Butyrivibrio sp.]MBP3782111.1 AAA family ATPase [Butyrivibrio sp.]